MDLADKVQQLQDELKWYSAEPQQQQANEQQQDRSPAERLLPVHADRMEEARNRLATPEVTPEPVKDAEHVATHMEYEPTGNQPAPSINGPGMSWTNPRSNWKPQGQDQPTQIQEAKQSDRAEDLADKVNRELKEEYAKGQAIEQGVERVNQLAHEEAERREREQNGRTR